MGSVARYTRSGVTIRMQSARFPLRPTGSRTVRPVGLLEDGHQRTAAMVQIEAVFLRARVKTASSTISTEDGGAAKQVGVIDRGSSPEHNLAEDPVKGEEVLACTVSGSPATSYTGGKSQPEAQEKVAVSEAELVGQALAKLELGTKHKEVDGADDKKQGRSSRSEAVKESTSTSAVGINHSEDDFEPTDTVEGDSVNFTEEELVLAVLSIDEDGGDDHVKIEVGGKSADINDQLLLPEILSDDDDDLFLRDDNLWDFYNQEHLENPEQHVELLEPEQLESVFDTVEPVQASAKKEDNGDTNEELKEGVENREEGLNGKTDYSLFHQDIGQLTDDDDEPLFDVDDLLEEEDQWRRQVNDKEEENKNSIGSVDSSEDFFVDQFPLLLPPLPVQDLAEVTSSSPLAEEGNPLVFCQPCQPDTTVVADNVNKDNTPQLQPSQFFLPRPLATISESETLLHGNQEGTSQGRVDIIGQLERLNISEKVETIESNKAETMNASSTGFGETIRGQAMEAALPFLDAFGCPTIDFVQNHDSSNTECITTKKSSNKSNERTCLGHKETIFGVAFSYCGKYCATASQDSTIRIWQVSNNRLLATLSDHSKDYECLRVAWASPTWADHCIDRGGTGSNEFQYLLASGGADGTVKLWGSCDPESQTLKCHTTLDHSTLLGRDKKGIPDGDDDEGKGGSGDTKITENNKPQVYALQFIDHWKAFTSQMTSSVPNSSRNSFIMTSSDDYIHFWEVERKQEKQAKTPQIIELDENQAIDFNDDIGGSEETEICLKEVMSLHFTSLEHYGYGVQVVNVTGLGLPLKSPALSSPPASNTDGSGFGGDRNPENMVFVFDASYCSANGLLGVALSDGSLRLVNGRGICLSVLTLPGCQSHLTSFAWDSTGHRLATCVATGHLISWTINSYSGGSHVEQLSNPSSFGADGANASFDSHFVAICAAILEGGHQPGRPLYGCSYCGRNSSDSDQEDLLVSWGVDGRLCLWDSYSQGNISSPIAILRDQSDYPIYAVAINSTPSASAITGTSVAVGGGSEGGFIGIPLYMFNVKQQEDSKTAASSTAATNVKEGGLKRTEIGANSDTPVNENSRQNSPAPAQNME